MRHEPAVIWLKLPMISVNKRRLKGKDQSVADLADKRVDKQKFDTWLRKEFVRQECENMSNSVLLPLALDRVTSVDPNSDSRKIPAQRAFSKHSKTYS